MRLPCSSDLPASVRLGLPCLLVLSSLACTGSLPDETGSDTDSNSDTNTTDSDTNVDTGDGLGTIATIPELRAGVVSTGRIATVQGVVVTGVARTGSGVGFGFFVQDPNVTADGGLWVYAKEGAEALSEGDVVDVTGKLREYNQGSGNGTMTQLELNDGVTALGFFEKTGSQEVPAPIAMTTVDLTDLGKAEAVEGMLIQLQDLTVADPSPGFGEWIVDDGVVIDDKLYRFDGVLIEEGTTVGSLTGVLDFAFDAYKVVPRKADDLSDVLAPYIAADQLSPGDVIISEIMYNPDECKDSACEWVEIYNTTGSQVDVGGLQVQDEGTGGYVVPSDTLIPADGYLVIGAGDGITDWTYGFTADLHMGSKPSFKNSGEVVFLKNNFNTLDSSAAYPDGRTAGRSWQLSSNALTSAGSSDASKWCSGDAAIPGTNGTDRGTPGAANVACGAR